MSSIMDAAISALVVTDPTHQVRPLNVLERAAVRIIRDPRDLPFVWLILAISLTVVPAAVLLISGVIDAWWALAAYPLFVFGLWYPTCIVMVHYASHRPLFRPQYAFLKHYFNWVVAPLFGMFPSGFYAHHVVMHHPENNSGRDLTCTMSYQRDSLMDFLRYFGKFLSTVLYELVAYLWRRKRYRLARVVVIVECSNFAIVLLVAWFNWQAALAVFVVPFYVATFALACTNWTEHAFIDHAAPQNIYRNSITCLNTIYNRIGFNDGYHTGHHLKPGLHWTQMPQEFLKDRATYASERAIVFDRIYYFELWFLLMTKQYCALARRCVDLDDSRRSEAATIELLRERTARLAA
jgi:fatty acid desaturase